MHQRILVGTDGSKTAQKAVRKAVEVAAMWEAELTILIAGTGAKAEQVVAEAAAEYASSGVEIQTLVVAGDPAEVLAETAEKGPYDLLVTGNKGMTGMRRFLTGSVPNRVGHRLPCDFLIVSTT